MVLAAQLPINGFVGNGAANTYSFTFPIFNQSVILVTVVSPTPNYAATVLQLGIDYSVSGLSPSGDPSSTGSITLINANQAWLTSTGFLLTGWQLIIQRSTPVAQTASIRNQGDYLRGYLENIMDTLAMIEQELDLSLLQCISLPPYILPTAFNPILPSNIVNGAGMAIGVNPTNNGLILLASLGSITIPVPFSQGGTGRTDGNIKFNAGKGIIGATDGTFPAAGEVGEVISTYAGALINGVDATWVVMSSIVLTPGRWNVWGAGIMLANGATLRNPYSWGAAISLFSGTPTDAAFGQNAAASVQITGVAGYFTNTIPAFEVSVTVNTTYYLDIICGFSAAGPPQLGGGMVAQRVA